MPTLSLDKTNDKTGRGFHVFAMACFIVFLLYRIALIFYLQPDIGGVEINIVYFIQRLLDGQSLYSDPAAEPYAIAQYSPLYYYLCTGVAKFFHVQAEDVLSIFTVSRVISFFLNLGYMYMVFLTAKNIFSVSARRSFYASVFAFIFLEITSFSRPDSLNHLFFLLSLYFFMIPLKQGKKGLQKEFFLAAIFSAIALFSKQTSLVLPLVFLGWLLWQKEYRKFFLFGLSYALTVAMLLSIFHFTTGLGLFYKNAVMGISNGISPGWFKGVILPGFYYGFGMFFLLLFIALFYIFKKGEKPGLLRFSFAALSCFFVYLNAIALKNGSNPGYYTEWWTLLFILTAFYWPQLTAAVSGYNSRLPGALLLLVLATKILLLSKPVYLMLVERPRDKMIAAYKSEQKIANYIISRLEPGDGYIVFPNFFTADSYLGCLLFRHMAVPQMDIISLAAYSQKAYDYSDFVKDLTTGKFKWMLMRTNWKHKQFFDIRLDKYEFERTEGGFDLYYYKP